MARRVHTDVNRYEEEPFDIEKLEDDYEEDLDDIDYGNYKGIYFNDDASKKYQDPETGAHFDHHDICMRLTRIAEKRRS